MVKKFWLLGMMLLSAVLFSMAVTLVDVASIGPEESKVGFSTLNKAVFSSLGENMKWDKITDVIVVVSILMAGIFLLIGVIQWLGRKSLKKVDKEILGLGLVLVLIGVVYIVFEKFLTINYRPILENGVLEPSFPSTHTLVTVTLLVVAMRIFTKVLQDKKTRIFLDIILVLMMGLMVFGRLAAGMHWLTDVVGAILWSGVIIMVYEIFFERVKIKDE